MRRHKIWGVWHIIEKFLGLKFLLLLVIGGTDAGLLLQSSWMSRYFSCVSDEENAQYLCWVFYWYISVLIFDFFLKEIPINCLQLSQICKKTKPMFWSLGSSQLLNMYLVKISFLVWSLVLFLLHILVC